MRAQTRAGRAVQALRALDQRGAGRVAGGMGAEATDRLGDLDSCTDAYKAWHPRLVPGVLQTPSYTAAAIKGHVPSLDQAEVGQRVTHRRRRAESFLARRASLERSLAWFIIGEQAITQPLLSPWSHIGQLKHLLEIIEAQNNVVVQVLPGDSPISATGEPFSVFHLNPGPVVAHLETMVGGFYTVLPEDIARLTGVFSDMVGSAYSTTDSREFIREEVQAWSDLEATQEPSSASPRTPSPTPASTSPDPSRGQ